MVEFSCKDCTNRSAECHATCEAYKRESEAHKQMLEANRIKNEHYRHVLYTIYKYKNEEAMMRKKRDGYHRKIK